MHALLRHRFQPAATHALGLLGGSSSPAASWLPGISSVTQPIHLARCFFFHLWNAFSQESVCASSAGKEWMCCAYAAALCMSKVLKNVRLGSGRIPQLCSCHHLRPAKYLGGLTSCLVKGRELFNFCPGSMWHLKRQRTKVNHYTNDFTFFCPLEKELNVDANYEMFKLFSRLCFAFFSTTLWSFKNSKPIRLTTWLYCTVGNFICFFYLFFFKPELWGGDSIQKCVRIQLFLSENTAHYFSSCMLKEMHLFTFTLKRGKFVALIYRLSCSRNIFRSNHFRAGSRKLWRNLWFDFCV